MHSDVQEDWTIKERRVVGLDALFLFMYPEKLMNKKKN